MVTNTLQHIFDFVVVVVFLFCVLVLFTQCLSLLCGPSPFNVSFAYSLVFNARKQTAKVVAVLGGPPCARNDPMLGSPLAISLRYEQKKENSQIQAQQPVAHMYAHNRRGVCVCVCARAQTTKSQPLEEPHTTTQMTQMRKEAANAE